MRLTVSFALALITLPAMASEQSTVPASASLKSAVTQIMTKKLMDGTSAQYRWLPMVKDSVVYCGFVNAKNSYGAFIGFQPFMVVGAEGKSGKFTAFSAVVGASAIGDRVQQHAARECLDAGYDIATIPD
jgi:hypothetical protein